MTRPYSIDLRKRAVAAVKNGQSRRQAAIAGNHSNRARNVMRVDVTLHRFMDTLEALGREPDVFGFGVLDRRSRQRPRDKGEHHRPDQGRHSDAHG